MSAFQKYLISAFSVMMRKIIPGCVIMERTIKNVIGPAEKLALDEKSFFKNDVPFKYADNDEMLKRLYGLK
jgi:hypothetical protein